jgi:hypothetical protein
MLHQLKAMRVRLLLHLRYLDGETSPSDDPPPARPSQYDNPIEILDLPYSAAAHAKPCSPVDAAMTLKPTLPRAPPPPPQPTDIDAAAVDAGAASAVVDEFEGEQGDALGSYVSFLLGAMQAQPEIGVASQPRVAGCDDIVTREPLDIEYAIAAIYDDLLDQQQPNHPPWLATHGNANANDLDLNEGDIAYISHLSHNDAAHVLDLNEYDDGDDIEGDDDMPLASAFDRDGAAAQQVRILGADAAAGGAWPVGSTGELDQLFCEEQMTLLTTETFEDVLLPDEESPQFD